MKTIHSINPATGEHLRTYPLLSDAKVENILEQCHQFWHSWRRTDVGHRAKLMHRAAEVLEKNKEKYAKMITEEMGKVYNSSLGEVTKCAWVCRYYADNTESFLAPEFIETDASSSYVSFQPMGIVLAVMPWNFPFWQVFRFAAPALMAGNVGILKHASNVPGCALFIEEVFKEAGFPEYAFKSLIISSRQVASVIENPRVKAVTLTGSEPAGASVASTAGMKIKKSVLELGGSDPYIILEDADLSLAAQQCTFSRLLNAGQSCIGAKRFLVMDSIYDAFLSLFKQSMENGRYGDPMTDVTMGPLARHDLRDEVHQQVLASIEAGAECILGGEIPDSPGAFYPATILAGVTKNMPAYHEEIFGPVATVIKVHSVEEAIFIANDTEFGLGAAIFSSNIEEAERIARDEIFAGSCFVNQFVKSDPRLPFGGIGISGYGRELSHYGIKEFVNVKTVYVK